jgi:hypothetical protein
MELDEMKAMWQKHNQQLDENLQLNEQILKQMKMKRFNDEFRKLYRFEVFNLVTGLIFMLVIGYYAFLRLNAVSEIVLSMVAMLVLLGYSAIIVFKMLGFKSLSGSEGAVLKVQKTWLQRKIKLLQIRKLEFWLMPFFFIALYYLDPLVFDKKEMPHLVVDILGKTFFATLITYFLQKWFNREYYDKKFKRAEEALQSISEFEQE